MMSCAFMSPVSDSILLIYRDVNKRVVNISESPSRATEVIRLEITTPNQIKEFIKSDLVNYAYYVMLASGAADRAIVDASFVDWYNRHSARETPKDSVQKEKRLADVKLVEKYGRRTGVTIGDKFWCVVLYVATGLGGVEEWSASGEISPFRIDIFSKRTVEADGSFYLFPQNT